MEETRRANSRNYSETWKASKIPCNVFIAIITPSAASSILSKSEVKLCASIEASGAIKST
jgi:hypothetical protein